MGDIRWVICPECEHKLFQLLEGRAVISVKCRSCRKISEISFDYQSEVAKRLNPDEGQNEPKEHREDKYPSWALQKKREPKTVFHVQSFIDNIAFPKSLVEVWKCMKEYGGFDLETLLTETETGWTAPRWAQMDDIVFFMHTKTSNATITALQTELHKNKGKYNAKTYQMLEDALKHGMDLYKKYGGKIFAIGRVCGDNTYQTNDGEEDTLHWKSTVYADIDNITVLENPIDIAEFRSFIQVSRQGAITAVQGEDFKQLKAVIGSKNKLPEFLRRSDATPMPLARINEHNWFELASEYRMNFFLEASFRSHYVNYLLSAIGDQKKLYRECRCQKAGMADSFVDNIIRIGGKFLPVEVKLHVGQEPNLPGQVKKYCYDDHVFKQTTVGEEFSPQTLYRNRCLVVDTDAIYMYDADRHEIEFLYDLDDLTSKEELANIRRIVLEKV